MVNTYQHTHDFAKELQEFVNNGQFPQVLKSLTDRDNFPRLYEMPHQSRYKLVHDIGMAVPNGAEHEYPEAGESAAFLLMSIPYEPLCPKEKEAAKEISKLLQGVSGSYDVAQRKALCQATIDVYSEMNGLENRVGFGQFWLPENPTEKQQDLYEGMEAFYFDDKLGHLTRQTGFVTDVSNNSIYSVLVKREYLQEAPIHDVIEKTLHEMRHHQQKESPGVEIASQEASGVNDAFRNRGPQWHMVYFALMEERQTYGYTGWVQAHNDGKRQKSEMEITSRNMREAGMSSSTYVAVLDFNYNYNDGKRISFKRMAEASDAAPAQGRHLRQNL